ncbi:MAG TPA: acetate--CoA ligase family protein [Phycisphaerae bacterium]|nr:acetate--CoA ligase family protein [Phycisphaerae bacterium]HOJ74752.1 acetate--CoA ligase family protein [Phycisphaerae bacterium]HOM52121.1 acetate--CoA ligase family protein [Phycisphaerae bacterium]HON65903.1 acetate--CoA ligase family protein [Phycisphaerae bacterium]HOQ85909.1 acetate--CoA ligase family protein [Phycisphaerae bacterium]
MTEISPKLNSIFYPKSVAVVGASSRPGTVGNDIFRNLLLSGFNGSVYPINPKNPHVLGVHAYASLKEVPGPVDLAVVIVPAKAVLAVVDEAIAKGVKGIVVISAGFKEVGHEGAQLELQLREKVRAAGIPLVGPNCLGVINTDPDVKMNAAFGRKMPAPGNLAFISQSGALCTSVLDYAEERSMGFSKFISFGNKADVNEIDLLDYLAQDPKTSVIAMYLEDVTNGRQFIETARQIFWETRKPMLCLKSGRSPEGAKAVSSHTGSLAGSDSVYDALLIQSGVQRVDTIAELFDYAALYTTQPLPKGNRVAIITNAGGPGIMATDAAVRHGLKLAEISEETRAKLKPALPDAASLRNPVDVIGDAKSDRYKAAVRTVLEDPGVDMGIVILTPQSMTDVEDTAAVVPESIKGINKPVVCSFMGARDVAPGVAILRKAGVPNYPFPEDAVKSLAAASKLVDLMEIPRRELPKLERIDVEKARQVISQALDGQEQKYLTQAECRPILEAYGLPLLASGIATSPQEAADIVKRIGKPVVMKVMSADVVHKFDAGGVILNVNGPEEAKATYDKILTNVQKAVPGAKIDGILIEEMARRGVEVILGASRDPRFGPLMMFGLGGTMVEVLKDVSFRLAPMWQISAERMVQQIRSFKVLDGFRGQPPADVPAIVDTLLRLSALVCNHPEVSELDINPLIVHAQGQGCSVADSRMMLRAASKAG